MQKKQSAKHSAPLSVPPQQTELLAPAGEIESAYAAYHYGADAIYLGLKKHSARAEAQNFTLEELDEVTAYAHSLTPKKRVFVTMNTLVLQSEIPSVVDSLSALNAIGVDAVIAQDLGVARIVRRYFPRLELHASTQMAIHSLAGASALSRLGFKRVTLARELTIAEIRAITNQAGIETEVFIHGALCYSYSGLCLFSSHVYGRSGNRGKCAYPCRELFSVSEIDEDFEDSSAADRKCMPFSMKDLALPDEANELRESGVSCLKIEGRMKSPLYVACVTNYYRKLLDGKLNDKSRKQLEADLQTIFSRPWTTLHTGSAHGRGVIDPDYVGHRGTYAGTVGSVFSNRQGVSVLRFKTERPLEVHDGLQIELPGFSKPYGFPIDRLVAGSERVARSDRGKETKSVFTVPAGAQVDIALPKDAPEIPKGVKVFCSSSQRVKRSYDYQRPKPGLHRIRHQLDVTVNLSPDKIHASGRAELDSCVLEQSVSISGPFEQANNASAMQKTVREAFSKLGDTEFALRKFEMENPSSLFVPVSRLNELRRMLTTALAEKNEEVRKAERAQIKEELAFFPPIEAVRTKPPSWSIKIDRLGYIDGFSNQDWENTDELILDIAHDSLEEILSRFEQLSGAISQDRTRLALPIITRSWEERPLKAKIKGLLEAGYYKWQAANLSAWSYLGIKEKNSTGGADVDLALDWSVGMLNTVAGMQALELGAHSFTLSPEDGLANMKELLFRCGEIGTVVVYQDTPLFISESCARASTMGCTGMTQCTYAKNDYGKCNAMALRVKSKTGDSFLVLQHSCRTIVVSSTPFCLINQLDQLVSAGARRVRADFIFRPYSSEQVLAIWRALRGGIAPASYHEGNLRRPI
jgi:U32 family peptidase